MGIFRDDLSFLKKRLHIYKDYENPDNDVAKYDILGGNCILLKKDKVIRLFKT